MNIIKSMSLPDGFLARHKCGDIFVETGTGQGGGIQAAIEAGFDRIYSVDVNNPIWKQEGRATLWRGDSRTALHTLLNCGVDINGPCTIFLDAHTRGHPSPLGAELNAVLKFKYPHTLIIDDMHRYKDGTWQPSYFDIVDELGKNYDLKLEPNKLAPDNLLVCISKND